MSTDSRSTVTVETTVRELLGDEAASDRGEIEASLQPDEPLSFEVYVPEGARQAGVLVYISPKSGAAMPDAWRPVLDRQNLAWVGANESGNEILVPRRVALAMLGPIVAATQGEVDRENAWLTGFSGGGRVASMMVSYFMESWRGAVFICGANPVAPLTEEQRQMAAERRFVFLTGTGDFNLMDTRMAIRAWDMAGYDNVALSVVDGMGHELPPARDMEAALAHVLGRPPPDG